MTQRRSLTNALQMTDDKLAFIKGRLEPATHAPESPQVVREPAGPQDETQVATTAVLEREVTSDEPTVRRRRTPRSSRREGETVRHESFMLPEPLVPLTTRIHSETADALRRAHLEQRLRRERPATQQDIVEAALSDWLREHQYL
jgi:hypothetical protein